MTFLHLLTLVGVHNTSSGLYGNFVSGGPLDYCGLDYCEGGILTDKYSAKSAHITTHTKMYPADENRWQCRKPHPKLCKPCYHSKTCPVHGLDFGRL